MGVDKEVILTAVNDNGRALEYAANTLMADKDRVLTAVKNYYDALKFAADSLVKSKEFVLEVVKLNGNALQHAGNDFTAEYLWMKRMLGTRLQNSVHACMVSVASLRQFVPRHHVIVCAMPRALNSSQSHNRQKNNFVYSSPRCL